MNNDRREPTTDREMADYESFNYDSQKRYDRAVRDMKDDGLNVYFQMATFVNDPHIKLQFVECGLRKDGFSKEQIELDLPFYREMFGVK